MQQQTDLSLVQLKILSKFLKKQFLKYSEGKPKDITNDLYKYHLGFLIKKGFIEKAEDKYRLTEKGKGTVQNFDISGSPRQLFKVSVLVYLTREINHKKEILMQKRLRQPYYGDIDTVSGKILPGEKVEDAAKRKLKEETGLVAEMRFAGVVRKIRKNIKNEVFEDTIYHVCFARNPQGVLIGTTEHGENFWLEVSEAKKMVAENITFGKYTRVVIDRATGANTDIFYFTEETTLKNI